MVSLDGGSADKVDDVTASRKEDGGYALLWQQQDGGYMLLWKSYGNNKMADMRIISLIKHLQQYSHRLKLLYFYYLIFIFPLDTFVASTCVVSTLMSLLIVASQLSVTAATNYSVQFPSCLRSVAT